MHGKHSLHKFCNRLFRCNQTCGTFLWIFYVFVLSCVCYVFILCACLFICALWSPAGKELTSWLSFVVSNYEFITFPLVSWVRCGLDCIDS